MAKVSIYDIKEELVVFLRNLDILSISDRGVTTSQDTGSFSADSNHTLATNPTLVKNVRDITVASIPLAFGSDYTVNYVTGVISFTSPQTGAYTINYDQGTSDKIYPDFPQSYLKLSSFPRIAVDIISGLTSEYVLGAGSNLSEYGVTIVAYDRDQSDVETMVSDIRGAIQNNKKNFYNFPFITPTALGPIMSSPFGEQKVFQRNQDCMIKFVHEI